MNKKFELLKDDYTIDLVGRTLYRIRALKDFANVKKGDIGGFVEKEKNLSHAGDCWIYRDAKVYNNARVSDDAKVCDREKKWKIQWKNQKNTKAESWLYVPKMRIYKYT